MEDILKNKKIITNGCSFSADPFSWPSLFPNYRNLSHHGAGNTYIRRQLQKEILESYEKYDFAIIQWSTIDRWDYPFVINSKDDTDIISMQDEDVVGKIGYLRMGSSYNKKSKYFYDNYYSIYGQLLETFENIYFTQLFLKEQKIPYLMFTIANLMTTDVSFEMIKNIDKINGDLMKQRISTIKSQKVIETFASADSLRQIKNKIDWSKFIWTTDYKVNGIGDGFTEYLISKGQIFGYAENTHPDEHQNKMIFDELIKPRVMQELSS